MLLKDFIKQYNLKKEVEYEFQECLVEVPIDKENWIYINRPVEFRITGKKDTQEAQKQIKCLLDIDIDDGLERLKNPSFKWLLNV